LRVTIFLLSLAAFASAASMRATDALLPRIAADFNVGIARAAWVVTGFTVAYALMQMLFGPLGDRFGKLRVIAYACGVAALASSACVMAPGFGSFVAARALTGAFCASVIPLSMAWIGDSVRYQDRQPVLARFLLGQILGLAGGAAVGGFAAEEAQWRWPFGVLALWLLAISMLLARAARNDAAPRAPIGTHMAKTLLGVLASSWARVVVLTVFAEGFLVFGALAFIPMHLHFARGIGLATAGLALVAFALGGVVFAVLARPIVLRLGEVALAVCGAFLLTAGFATVALAPSAALAALGCFVAGVGFYSLHNTLQTNATQMAPERRGAAMALFASLFFLGQSLGVALAGLLVEHAGTTAVLLGAGLGVTPVGITFARLRKARARREREVTHTG
jgi:predicted MFS family arabinose efflux permease